MPEPQICVTFKSIEDPVWNITYAPYSIFVPASNYDEAQEKAIERVENLKMIHGEIIKMEKI